MKLSNLTINKISEFVTGESQLSPYRSGRELTELFNEVDIPDIYQYGNGGLPDSMSRSNYTKDRLNKINDSENIAKILTLIFDSRLFVGTEYDFEKCIKQANQILSYDNVSIEISSGRTKITGYDIPDEITIKPVFENIESNIIEEISLANFSIWLAVGWFTNKEIARELFRARQRGLNVRILIIDDEINSKSEIPFEDYFEINRCKPRGYLENIMHCKFCIIDLKTVIHGSYNYTNKANYNDETISIETSRQIAEQYASQFIKIFNKNNELKKQDVKHE